MLLRSPLPSAQSPRSSEPTLKQLNAMTLRPLFAPIVVFGACFGSVTGCGSDGNGGALGGSGPIANGGATPGGATSTGGSVAGVGATNSGAGGSPAGGVAGAAAAASNAGASSAGAVGGTGSGGAGVSGEQSGGGNAFGGLNAGGRGSAKGGQSSAGGNGGTGIGGSASAGTPAGGASTAGSGGATASAYPCDGTTSGYNAVAIKSGSTWTVTNGAREVYSGTDLQQALSAAYGSLTPGRTTKQSILVQGSGDISATVQLSVPSYTILNVCGTINVSGTPSGSDRSPIYARNARDIDIPNLKMTGSPQYGLFFRQTNNVHLGQIDLRLTSSAGIGIRVDSGGNAQSTTDFNENLTIDYVYGSGMASHVVETYGIRNIKIGTVEGKDAGECGLLFNRSTHAEVGLVTCSGCGTGTGYAAFRVANSVGKVGNEFPAGNIHVGKVYARGGGRGIFSVSGSGGLTIDEIDIANTGNGPILLQNAYNTTIAAKSGTVSGGLVQISNDTDNTNSGTYPPSKNVALKNLTLSNGASVRQDWCSQFGSNGCTATNITGGTVSMCP